MASPSTPSSLRRPPGPLRVVFFGPPQSGKSNLFDSFGRIAVAAGAEEQPVQLAIGPQPTDTAGRRMIERITSVDLPDDDLRASSITLIDCNSEAVGQLLGDATALTRPRVRDELLDAIRSAEALVVTVDVTDTPSQIDELSADLGLFLQALREGRAFIREVGGLPVFLAVTKCDTLYEAGFTPRDWAQAVEQERKDIRARFDDIAKHEPDALFGAFELHSEGVADRVPPQPGFDTLADDLGMLHGQDLFNAVLDAASEYRDRRRQSKRRLNWTITVALGVLALLLGGFALLATTGEPGPVEALAMRVRQAREQEGPPEVRLADRGFARNRDRLAEFRAAPYFAALPADLRQWVDSREKEFAAYAEYRNRFHPPRLSPAEARTASALDEVTGDLTDELTPPEEYAKEWAKTEAVQLRDKWAKDRDLLVKTEDEIHGWYRGLISRSTNLMTVEVPDAGWREKVAALLADADRPPARPTDPIPGSPEVKNVRRGQPLTYAAAFDFERSDLARQDWEFAGRKLADLRDLTDALGLTADPTKPGAPGGAPLDLPEPTGDPATSLPLGSQRWQAIRERFPRAADGSANWSANFFPDPVRKQLASRSRVAADTALRHVRRMILAEMTTPGRADTHPDWLKLADGLLAKPELRDWGQLLQLLLKAADLEKPNASPPIADLIGFVKKPGFAWSPTGLELFLPNAVLTDAYAPDGNLTITIQPERGPPRVTAFGGAKAGERIAAGVPYRFAVVPKSAALVYTPGDKLTAELPVAAGAKKYKLVWTAGGTSTYQFDRLTREPVLESADGKQTPATGVTLTWLPATAAVTVPELLPVLK